MKLLKDCCGLTDNMDILYDSKIKKLTTPRKEWSMIRRVATECRYCNHPLELSDEAKQSHFKLTGEVL